MWSALGAEIALQIAQTQIVALPAPHVPDQRPLGPCAVAHREHAHVARAWSEAGQIDAGSSAIP